MTASNPPDVPGAARVFQELLGWTMMTATIPGDTIETWSYHICVTRDDIDNGKPFRPRMCPIALAMTRAGFRNPYVYIEAARFGNDNGAAEYIRLTRGVRDWIHGYDQNGGGEPFALVVEPDRRAGSDYRLRARYVNTKERTAR